MTAELDTIAYEGRDFTEDEARRLTAEIKAWAGTLWVKLKHAHDGRAYKAMGYSTWVDYLRDEFDISKSQGYRLLAHARTMDQLADAAGLYEASPIGDIPEGHTRDLDLLAVADEIAEQVHALPHDATDSDRAAIVAKVVEEHKTTTTTTTKIDADTGEIMESTAEDDPIARERPTVDGAPPATGAPGEQREGSAAADGGEGDRSPAASSPPLSPVPDAPAPTFAAVGDVIDWCPEDGQWAKYEEFQRSDGTRQFARLMDRRLPRDEDADLGGLCPPEAIRSAIFAAECAITYWTDLAADLKRRQNPSTTDGRHLAAVEG